MFLPLFVCLSVCWQANSKTRAWIWMKCCVSTDVGTWTNWLTFEPNPDYSPDAGTGLLSPISCALQRGILLCWENLAYRYWAPVAAAMHGFKMVLFTASRGNYFVGGTCAPPSALLVCYMTQMWSIWTSIVTEILTKFCYCTLKGGKNNSVELLELWSIGNG